MQREIKQQHAVRINEIIFKEFMMLNALIRQSFLLSFSITNERMSNFRMYFNFVFVCFSWRPTMWSKIYAWYTVFELNIRADFTNILQHNMNVKGSKHFRMYIAAKRLNQFIVSIYVYVLKILSMLNISMWWNRNMKHIFVFGCLLSKNYRQFNNPQKSIHTQ